ncbi:unnamed protein product [Prorocentrum cordatum]|uniref:Uncharacterized protein n=1 Tax=Prorocentrum cordatum TaxID=2364126 RepID=A0ABN9X056_9DINO|nr:unnamed protein product [Polarella glacialis]
MDMLQREYSQRLGGFHPPPPGIPYADTRADQSLGDLQRSIVKLSQAIKHLAVQPCALQDEMQLNLDRGQAEFCKGETMKDPTTELDAAGQYHADSELQSNRVLPTNGMNSVRRLIMASDPSLGISSPGPRPGFHERVLDHGRHG